MRKEYKLTDEELEQFLNASKPVPYIIVGGRGPRSSQEKANIIWQSLGEKYGFKYMTAKSVPGKSQEYFTAEAKEGEG